MQVVLGWLSRFSLTIILNRTIDTCQKVIESQILSQSRTQTQVRRISRFPSHTDLLLKVVVFLTQSYFMAFEDFLYAAQTCMF